MTRCRATPVCGRPVEIPTMVENNRFSLLVRFVENNDLSTGRGPLSQSVYGHDPGVILVW